MIVRPNAGATEPLTKGIVTHAQLDGAIRRAARASTDDLAHVETDLRANCNPTRLREIALLARQLARRLSALCPAGHTPGWGVSDVVRGLACAWCRQPTRLVALEVHGCVVCVHRDRRPRADGLREADPGQCDYCNP